MRYFFILSLLAFAGCDPSPSSIIGDDDDDTAWLGDDDSSDDDQDWALRFEGASQGEAELTLAAPLTVDFWIRRHGIVGDGYLVDTSKWELYHEQGALRFFVYPVGVDTDASLMDFEEGRWHHLAIQIGDEITLLIDGEVIVSEPYEYAYDSSGSIVLGNSHQADSALTGVDIDNLRFSHGIIYDFPDETSPGTYRLWHLNEGAGDTAYDVFGNPMALTGEVWVPSQ